MSENETEIEAQVKEKRHGEMVRSTFASNAGDYDTEPLMVDKRAHD